MNHNHTKERKMVGVTTRSSSQSASSAKSSDSSSSGSSSSASSSSSSSSGSGSDSSSSDTEASQDSRVSRSSRASRKSNSNNEIKPTTTTSKGRTKVAKPHQNNSSSKTIISATKGSVNNKHPIPSSSSFSPFSKNNEKEKKNSSTSKGGARVKPIISKMAQKKFTKKPPIGSSSESESRLSNTTNNTSRVKRVGSKPATVSVSIIASKQSGSVTNLNPIRKKSPLPKTVDRKSSKVSSKSQKESHATSSTSGTKASTSKKQIMKDIFSDQSSEESDSKFRKSSRSSNALQKSIKNTTEALVNKKKAITSPPPVVNSSQKEACSSSISETSTNSSSSASSSASSSESEKKDKSATESSPKSPSGRKRPVTRRRTVKSKTIPTTTMFTESGVRSSWESGGGWGGSESSGGCGSDGDYLSSRVPAKTSLRPHPPHDNNDEEEEEGERVCPFPTCDSSGHLSGKFPTHSMLSTCPKYQGFSTDECKENAIERKSREAERKKMYNILHPHQKKSTKLSHDAKLWVSKLNDLKEKTTKDGLCSEYDMGLWVDALAGAAGKIEEEQSEGIGYRSVALGKFEISCWCESPYPEPLSHSRRIFICEFCLKPAQSGTVLRRHCAKCVWRHPPGDEIYRKDRLSVWEVDGKTQKTYCQNLCLLAKCFLDHKTLYLDVDPFLFYVMTVADSQGCHLVGYFSKEKNSFLNYNVSCILTLPPYQRKGFGRLLIDFSYLLTRVEGKVGSPEKPLSDLGLISYRSYWKDAVLRRMCACATREMVVKDLSIELGVTSGDLISTLQFLGMLKYWKGKHIVLKKQDVLEEYLERVRRRGETKQIDPSCLRWRPFQPPTEPST